MPIVLQRMTYDGRPTNDDKDSGQRKMDDNGISTDDLR